MKNFPIPISFLKICRSLFHLRLKASLKQNTSLATCHHYQVQKFTTHEKVEAK